MILRGNNMKSRFKEVFICSTCLRVDLNGVLKSAVGEIKIAYILHDKNPTVPHYHIFFDYGKNSVDNVEVTKLLKVSDKFVLSARGRNWSEIKKYMVHTHNYEYSDSDIVSNFDLSIY